ncbi:MAG: DnaD domain protein [Chloroflexi bacterium]|nr:DnaD domain protein [Chloroflexota bacterium]
MSNLKLFTDDMAWVRIPAPLFGQLLSDINNLLELKVLLRALWHIDRKKGVPRPITAVELSADRLMAEGLSLTGDALTTQIGTMLDSLTRRGVFAQANSESDGLVYVLNTSPERRALAQTGARIWDVGTRRPESWDSPIGRPAIFELYEQNIGALTPIVAERIKEAADQYPDSWIREAIGLAAENNARNWRYVTAILERWQTEGREDGEPRRDPEELRQEGFRKAYDKYVRRT